MNFGSLGVLHGAHGHSLNVRGAYLHVLGDALGSVGALAAALVVRFTGWTAADPIGSILLSLRILFGAWRLLRESVDILLEIAPGHVDTGRVRAGMLAVPGVRAVHDLHIWSVTSGVVAMSGHAVVPELGNHPAALQGLRRAVAGLGMAHATIQLEVEDEGGGVDCMEVVAVEGHGAQHHRPGMAHPHPH